MDLAFDPLGLYAFVALETSRQVAVLDVNGGMEVMRLGVGRAPQGVAVSADGRRLYVNNFMDRTVSVFDLSTLLTEGIADVPLVATKLSHEGDKLSAQVRKGKKLFYDAAEKAGRWTRRYSRAGHAPQPDARGDRHRAGARRRGAGGAARDVAAL